MMYMTPEQSDEFKKQLEDILKKNPQDAEKIQQSMDDIAANPEIGRPIRGEPTDEDLEHLRSYIGKPISKSGWWDYTREEPATSLEFDVEWPDKILDFFGAEVYINNTQLIGLDNILDGLRDILRNKYVMRSAEYKDDQLCVTFGKDSDAILVKAGGWDLEDNPPKTILDS